MSTLDVSDLTLKVETQEDTSTVKVAWCVSPRLSDYLKQHEARDPHILLLIVSGDGDHQTAQQYQVVPLQTGMTFVGLRHAGINVIRATVVWRMAGEPKPSRAISKISWVYDRGYAPELEILKKRREMLWHHEEEVTLVPGGTAEKKIQQMLDDVNQAIEDIYDGPRSVVISSEISSVIRAEIDTQVEVAVTPDKFAPEPHPVEKWLANFASPKRKRDECHSRKYALLGLAKLIGLIILSPVILAGIVVLWVCSKLLCILVAIAYLLWGYRTINWRAIFTWGIEPPGDLRLGMKPSVWWYKKVPSQIEEDPATDRQFVYTPRHPITLVANPPVVLAVIFAIWSIVALDNTWLTAFWVVVALIALGFGTSTAIIAHHESKSGRIQRQTRRQAKLAHELERVTCDAPQQSGVVDCDLKPAQLTPRLVFLETKNKVCKPFSE